MSNELRSLLWVLAGCAMAMGVVIAAKLIGRLHARACLRSVRYDRTVRFVGNCIGTGIVILIVVFLAFLFDVGGYRSRVRDVLYPPYPPDLLGSRYTGVITEATGLQKPLVILFEEQPTQIGFPPSLIIDGSPHVYRVEGNSIHIIDFSDNPRIWYSLRFTGPDRDTIEYQFGMYRDVYPTRELYEAGVLYRGRIVK